MSKVRVLVVDDAVVVRRMLTDIIAQDSNMEVVGSAANGTIALARIPQVNPDVLTLDVEMPVMDGLTTLVEIRKTYPKLPVVMFSTLTRRGAEAALDALALGANDYVTKPANVGSVQETFQRIRDELIPKLLHLGRPSLPRPEKSVVTPRFQPRGRIEVVTIGVSTGGPNALADLVPMIPPNFPVPVLIVQHMPPLFTQLLAERLGAKSKLLVREAKSGETIQPGKVWLAPGGLHMELARESDRVFVRLTNSPPENSCRPAVDVLFRSAAKVYGAACLGVVLTGMGHDGQRGSQNIKEAGGQVIVQDEASSVVWGMPGSVVAAGLADRVVALRDMAPEIVRLVNVGRSITVPKLIVGGNPK